MDTTALSVKVSNLEIPRHYKTSSLLLKVLDHYGIAGPLVPGPVPHLAIPATVRDREALGALIHPVAPL